MKRIFPWLAFLALIGAYGLLYAPYGFENNDGGFILGLSHQVFQSSSLYDYIIYIRPPVSPILHSLLFQSPFSGAPVFYDRLFVYAQIATYSALSSVIAARHFGWPATFAAAVAALAFVLSAHAFPPMAWHTIDGIFFSVLALYFLVRGLKRPNHFMLFVSACCALLAAGSKQPFYLTLISVPVLCWFLSFQKRTFLLMLVWIALAFILGLTVLQHLGSLKDFWPSIASQTTITDLIQAGVSNFLSDLRNARSILIVVPLAAALALSFWSAKNSRLISAVALLASIWLALAIVTYFYASATAWRQPTFIFDSIYTISLLYTIVRLSTTRQTVWMILLAMHIVAWCASISWGYLTTALYAAPSVITLASVIYPAFERTMGMRVACIALLPAALIVFYIGNRYTYSLEGSVSRLSNDMDMEVVHPSLKYIKATSRQYQLYVDLLGILRQFPGRSFVVLPNLPLAHMLAGSANPIGIDWPLNGEVGPHLQLLKDRLNVSVDIAIVYNKAKPKPQSDTKTGSHLTVYVIENWKLAESTDSFSLFINPRNVRIESATD